MLTILAVTAAAATAPPPPPPAAAAAVTVQANKYGKLKILLIVLKMASFKHYKLFCICMIS